jgi:hypothetical protein
VLVLVPAGDAGCRFRDQFFSGHGFTVPPPGQPYPDVRGQRGRFRAGLQARQPRDVSFEGAEAGGQDDPGSDRDAAISARSSRSSAATSG